MLRRNLKLKTVAIFSVALLVILAGLLVGAVRLADLAAPKFRDEVAARISQIIERPVTIGALDLSWDWTGPVLHLEQAALLDALAGEPVIRLESLALRFSFSALIRGDTMPQGLLIQSPQLAAYRDAQGRLQLRGVAAGGDTLDWEDIASKISQFESIQVTGGELLFTPGPTALGTLHFTELALTLTNQGQRHRLDVQVQLPASLGSQAQFEALVVGEMSAPQQLEAHAYFRGQQLDAAALAGAAGVDFELPATGRNDVEVWSDWRNGGLASARASIASGAIEPGQVRLLPDGTGLDLSLRPVADGYSVSLDALHEGDRFQPGMSGKILIHPETRRVRAELQALPASLLGGWLTIFDASAAWQLNGRIEHLALLYDAGAEPAELSGRVQFAELDISNPAQGFQITGLNGELALNPDRSGQLQLAAADGALIWAGKVNGELPLDTLQGEIDWQRQASGWSFNAVNLRWLGADAEVSANGEVRIPDEGTPSADITAQVQAQDLPRVLAYIPQDPELPNPRLREWLPTAVRGGKLLDGTLRLRGPLDRFPYAQGGGEFRIEAQVENADLDYKPGWPPLTQGNGRFTLEGDTLSIDAKHGQMLGVEVGPASARVGNVREPVLEINGEVIDADAGKLLAFLANSPLEEEFGRLTRILDIDGQADLTLDLRIPLKSELGDVKSDGVITLKDTTLAHKVLPEPIQDINGKLRFSRQGLAAEGLRGSLLGLPLVADLNPAQDSGLSINASTLLQMPRDRAALQRFVPDAVAREVGGESVWHAVLRVAPDGSVSDLALRSDLEGTRLDFPPPLRKAAQGPLPIRVEISSDRKRIHVDLANRLDMVLRSSGDHITRLQMIFGDTGADMPEADGIWLGGTIQTLDAFAWQDFIGGLGDDANAAGEGAAAPLRFRGADLRIEQTLLGGQRLGRVQLKVSPTADGQGWTASLAGPGASGELRLLPPPQTTGARALLSGEFAHIRLTPVERADDLEDGILPDDAQSQTPPRDPATFPVTDLRIDSIRLDDTNLGHLDLQARAIEAGTELVRLEMAGGELAVSANGSWTRKDGLSQARLNATVDGAGLAGLFQALGYAANIRAEDAEIKADLRVAANADGLVADALNGTLKMKFEDGTLISVDPGAARVLGLFNFYALPRRLLLDFRDVVNEGLAFDSIRGDFTIDSGVAYSDNLRIKTPSATVKIDGVVNLAERSYDQRVTIVPKVSSGVALAGTVLGGPAVGAVLLLAQKLLEKPIEDISTISYRLTGDWQDPTIDTITAEQSENADNKQPAKSVESP